MKKVTIIIGDESARKQLLDTHFECLFDNTVFVCGISVKEDYPNNRFLMDVTETTETIVLRDVRDNDLHYLTFLLYSDIIMKRDHGKPLKEINTPKTIIISDITFEKLTEIAKDPSFNRRLNVVEVSENNSILSFKKLKVKTSKA